MFVRALLISLLLPFTMAGQALPGPSGLLTDTDKTHGRVIIAADPNATDAFLPNDQIVRSMVVRGLVTLTGKDTVAEAWKTLANTNDVVGIKVLSAPGRNSGTRPAVAAAVVETLIESGHSPRQIILWDKHRADLRAAGFFGFVARYGIRVEGSAATGYDDAAFYETAIMGHLVFGDWEFGRKQEDGVGRKSFVSKLVSQEMTKIINITPLLNHNRAGVSGTLYSLSMGSVDNTLRFEQMPNGLATAVPEIYGLPQLFDKVVLNIVDALLCQYQGEQRMLLHYSRPLNQLWLSKDAVAVDVLALVELERQRQLAEVRTQTNHMELFQNASLLQLGVSDLRQIHVERAP